jgi:hypothetical protein
MPHLTLADYFRFGLDGLLLLAALLCALCAWTHEALMRQATEAERQNKRYGKSLDKFGKQIGELKGVQKDLLEFARKFGQGIDELDNLLHKLAHLSNLNHVCDLMQDFVRANARSVHPDGMLCGPALVEFLQAAQTPLRLSGVDRDEIHKTALQDPEHGITFFSMACLSNALITHAFEPERAEALRHLFSFAMRPQHQDLADEVVECEHLFRNDSTLPQGSIAAALKWCQQQAGDEGPVPGPALEGLIKAFAFSPLGGKPQGLSSKPKPLTITALEGFQ